MSYKVEFTKSAQKEIENLEKVVKERIANALEFLANSPFIGKPLREPLKGLYSDRVGNYRIIYKRLKSKQMIVIYTRNFLSPLSWGRIYFPTIIFFWISGSSPKQCLSVFTP